jgi:small subunit ribosomal protein S16
MSVVIRLMRAGAKKRPFFRMVAADSRRQRDGRFLEILGHYNPLTRPYDLVVHKDKVERWLSRGAQPSEQVASLLRSVGVSMGRPSVSRKKATEGAGKDAGPAPAKAKKVVKRAAARKQSERKVEKKAARKVAKTKRTAKA